MKKQISHRLLALALAVCMVAVGVEYTVPQAAAKAYHCSLCNESEYYSYSSNGSSGHTVYVRCKACDSLFESYTESHTLLSGSCSDCGYKSSSSSSSSGSTHTHSYTIDSYTSNGSSTHTIHKSCSCGATTTSTGSHSYSGNTCKYCGYTKVTHTHSYSISDYSSNGASTHTITYTCSCGDSYTSSASHSMGSKSWSGCDWTQSCTACGYTKSGTSHGSTTTLWNGCTWTEYCDDCAEALDWGTSHSYYISGYTYANSSNHTVTHRCSGCGTTYTSTAAHSTTTKYGLYNASQHAVYGYCATCNTNVTTTYAAHNLTYGSWTQASNGQHQRTVKCTTCGYSTTETKSHALSYGNWTKLSDTQCQRTVTCSDCGYSTTETKNHALTYGAWTAADGSQCRRTVTCSDCGYARTETQSHTLTYGDWAEISDIQHQRGVTCTTCGYATTEEQAHALTYGSWVKGDDDRCKRSVNCTVCAYTTVEYQPHTDENGDKLCDDCGAVMAVDVIYLLYGDQTVTVISPYGKAVTVPEVPTRLGYDFSQWIDGNGATYDFTAPIYANTTITAEWTARTDTPYTVEHYQQTVEGNYILAETEQLTGTTDTTATAVKKAYVGFHFAEGAENVLSGQVAADGSLTLKVYYNRDRMTVSVDLGGNVRTSDIPYGGTLTEPETPTREGYDFAGWVDGDGKRFDFSKPVEGDVTLIPTWTPRTDTPYTIEHYKQVMGGYTLAETEHLTGTTDSTVFTYGKTYDGYHFAESAKNVLSGKITADGSLILKVYYDSDEEFLPPDNSEEDKGDTDKPDNGADGGEDSTEGNNGENETPQNPDNDNGISAPEKDNGSTDIPTTGDKSEDEVGTEKPDDKENSNGGVDAEQPGSEDKKDEADGDSKDDQTVGNGNGENNTPEKPDSDNNGTSAPDQGENDIPNEDGNDDEGGTDTGNSDGDKDEKNDTDTPDNGVNGGEDSTEGNNGENDTPEKPDTDHDDGTSAPDKDENGDGSTDAPTTDDKTEEGASTENPDIEESGDGICDDGLTDSVTADLERLLPAEWAENVALTRGQTVYVLSAFVGASLSEPLTASFDDVTAKTPYAKSIAWAKVRGMIFGYGGGKFGSEDPVTKEQLAVMLYRIFGNGTKLITPTNGSVSWWAQDAVCWATDRGLLAVTELPQGTVTKSELIHWITRLLCE